MVVTHVNNPRLLSTEKLAAAGRHCVCRNTRVRRGLRDPEKRQFAGGRVGNDVCSITFVLEDESPYHP